MPQNEREEMTYEVEGMLTIIDASLVLDLGFCPCFTILGRDETIWAWFGLNWISSVWFGFDFFGFVASFDLFGYDNTLLASRYRLTRLGYIQCVYGLCFI